MNGAALSSWGGRPFNKYMQPCQPDAPFCIRVQPQQCPTLLASSRRPTCSFARLAVGEAAAWKTCGVCLRYCTTGSSDGSSARCCRCRCGLRACVCCDALAALHRQGKKSLEQFRIRDQRNVTIHTMATCQLMSQSLSSRSLSHFHIVITDCGLDELVLILRDGLLQK